MMSSQQREDLIVVHSPEAGKDDGSVYIERNGFKSQVPTGGRIYPCSKAETYAINNSKFGTMNTVQSIWLASDHQIKPENVSKALWIITRQVPHLQFCFAKVRETIWAKRMSKLDIDFETSEKEPLEMHHEMLNAIFDPWKGPLWKVRFNTNTSHCNSKNKKYTSFLTLGVHHAITDATTNMKICRDLISILIKLSAGEDVVPTFSPVCPTMDEITSDIQSNVYALKKAWKKIYSTIIKNFTIESSFNNLINVPIPKAKTIESKVIFDDFSKSETDRILELCREAKITINSFIITIANFALMAVAQSKSKIPIGRRKIVTLQAINMRRYYEPQYSDSSGCHISYMEDEFQMDLANLRDFWSVANKIHLNMKDRIEVSKEPVKNILLMPLSFKLVPVNHFLTSKGFRNRTICHYFTTNMGNLKDLLPEPKEGDGIEITNLLRSTFGPYCGTPFVMGFHTFRGRLSVSLDYRTNTMTTENAQLFMDLLFLHVRNLILN